MPAPSKPPPRVAPTTNRIPDELPKLKTVLANQEAANLLMLGLQMMWRANCSQCKREDYAPGSGAMLAAHEFRENGWTAVSFGLGAKLICPDCGIL